MAMAELRDEAVVVVLVGGVRARDVVTCAVRGVLLL